MTASKGRSNAQTLFGVHQIPSDNQIRKLLDEVEPAQVFPVFEEIFRVFEQGKHLSGFRSFQDNLLIALDGTEYFCSTKIHCQHCSTRTFKNGTTQYFHAAVTPVIVCPGNSKVIAQTLEFGSIMSVSCNTGCGSRLVKCIVQYNISGKHDV